MEAIKGYTTIQTAYLKELIDSQKILAKRIRHTREEYRDSETEEQIGLELNKSNKILRQISKWTQMN